MDAITAFMYCPRCSAKFKNETNYLLCSQCGLHYYHNPKPCNSLVLRNSKGEYLLVERAVEPMKGWWDLPGGFVEVNETFEESARREAFEELGIQLGQLRYIGSFYDTYHYQDIIYAVLAVSFLGIIADNVTLTAADDVAGYQFFTRDELPLDRLAFPSIRQTFEALRTD